VTLTLWSGGQSSFLSVFIFQRFTVILLTIAGCDEVDCRSPLDEVHWMPISYKGGKVDTQTIIAALEANETDNQPL